MTTLSESFAIALQCAASIMSTEPPAQQYAVNVAGIPVSYCIAGGRAACGAVYMATRPRPSVIFNETDALDWSLWVHEACHAVQDWQGRQISGGAAEAECEAVAAQAYSCPVWGGN